MPDVPVIGATTVLACSPDGATYSPIANLVDLKLPKFMVGKVDKSHSGSTATASLTLPGATATANFTVPIKTYGPGWLEPGEPDFKVYLTKTQHAQLKALQYSRQIYYWKITLPNDAATPSTDVWQGFVTDVEADIATLENKLIEATVKIQQTGVDTFTAGT